MGEDQLLLPEFDRLVEKFKQAEPLFYAEIPIVRHIVKKNRRPIHGRGERKFIGKSPELRLAEQFLTLNFRSLANQYAKAHGIIYPIVEPVWCIFHFYIQRDQYYTQKGYVSAHNPDLSNVIELPQDCLETAGVIKNDNQIRSLDFSRILPGDKTKLELWIMRHQFDFVRETNDGH